MTYEAEMKEYLQAKKLPADEGTYPDELMTQITIKAFDELTDRIEELTNQLMDADNDLCDCETKVENLNDKLEDFQLTLKQIKELVNEGV